MKKSQRVVGFDCAEDEHIAVLLDTDGEFSRRSSVVNEGATIRGAPGRADLVLAPKLNWWWSWSRNDLMAELLLMLLRSLGEV